jgi:hypothetical protein
VNPGFQSKPWVRISERFQRFRISKLFGAVIHDLPVVAISITVASDLFTVLQSEVNSHHVFKDPWVVLTSDCEIRAGRLTRCEFNSSSRHSQLAVAA